MPDDKSFETQGLTIDQANAKRALAIFAHLRQILRTSTKDGAPQRPIAMDHGDLLLSSASFRALFFDDVPMFLGFMESHSIEIEIDTIETNIGLLLLSWLAPDAGHVSDFFLRVLLDKEIRTQFPLNSIRQILLTFESPSGLESVMQNPSIWAPTEIDDPKINAGPFPANANGPTQLIDVTRRRVKLEEWGNVRIGFLKNRPINRRNLITYVANKLGGVHYDSKRFPSASDDADQFRLLATAYDWDNQAIMHAGLVATGIACIEILNSPIRSLLTALGEFHAKRQQRLLNGDKLTS